MVRDVVAPALTVNPGETVAGLLKQSLRDSNLDYKKYSENNYAIIRKQAAPAPGTPEQPKGKGAISGTVLDEAGETLTGATVTVAGTTLGTATDFNGRYVLKQVPAGTHTIEVRFISYQTRQVANVQVNAGEVTLLNVELSPASESIGEVKVTGQANRASNAGMRALQKQSISMMDAISAELIAKTPDSDVGATLKRITGVTTLDNKYVVVRSMSDRWNQAVMDGINLPSTDAYQQHFSFDIIPNSIVDGIVVTKTATPDMNANFVGGAVEVRTKDIPAVNFTTFSAGASYNSRSTFEDRVTKQRGDYDYFGFDDGTRDYPDVQAIPRPGNEAEAGPFIENSRLFTQDNFTDYTVKTPVNTSYQFSIGRAYKLKGYNQWGFAGALTLKNTQEAEIIDHTERGQWMNNSLFIPAKSNGKYYTLEQWGFKNEGASYGYNSTLAGLLNAGIQLGGNHLTLRNTYTHFYDNQLTQITGWYYYNNDPASIINGDVLPFTETVNYPVYQSFIQNKLEGSHLFGKTEINWFAARSHTKKDTKDATFTTVYRNRWGDDLLDGYQISNSGADIYRENHWNRETDYNWGAAISRAFQIGATQHHVKAGYSGARKKAENQQEKATMYWLVENPAGKYTPEYLPFSELLDGSYYRWGGYGWEKYNYYGDKYVGRVETHAPFVMADHRFAPWLRLVWGVRAEYYQYTQLQSQLADSSYITEQLDDKKWRYMPSVNLTFTPLPDLNIRLGYNRSVIRPQFAERLQVPYYDPVRAALVLANRSGVVSSVSENFDFKVEWFPSPGEILSAGVYYKDIDKPIESVTRLTNEGSRRIYNVNSKSAELWGVEVEVRKNLSFLGEGQALENLYLSGNATFNWTKVTAYSTSRNEEGGYDTYKADRPMAGQSPYAYNLGIDYTGERLGFGISYNASGDQYLTVGLNYNAEEIRMPYSVTDVQVSWKFLRSKKLELRAYGKNIFDTPFKTYNNFNSYTGEEREDWEGGNRKRYTLAPGATDKYDENIDFMRYESYKGATFGLSVKYNL
jgi:hypothetical protein